MPKIKGPISEEKEITDKELPSIFDMYKVVTQERIDKPPVFAFEIGQKVRICVKLDNWWPEIDSWKGQIGTVVKRYEAGMFFVVTTGIIFK